MVSFLLLESMVVGVFCSLDAIMFYLFFEGMLIPMYIIIGVWGGKQRVYAAYKFFLYTLAGSVLFLIAVVYLYLHFDTSNIPALIKLAPQLALNVQKWLWLAYPTSRAIDGGAPQFHRNRARSRTIRRPKCVWLPRNVRYAPLARKAHALGGRP